MAKRIFFGEVVGPDAYPGPAQFIFGFQARRIVITNEETVEFAYVSIDGAADIAKIIPGGQITLTIEVPQLWLRNAVALQTPNVTVTAED